MLGYLIHKSIYITFNMTKTLYWELIGCLKYELPCITIYLHHILLS